MIGTGMIDPNGPRSQPLSDDTGSPKSPTEDEKELAKQIDKLFEKYARHRRKYDKDWVENYKFYRGDQHSGKRASYRHREVINMVFQTIQSQTSVMLDVRPTLGFLPQEPSDLEVSEILNQVFESDWQRNNWMDEIAAIVYDAHLYSIGNSETGYDKNIVGGRGGIKFRAVDPFSCYPDPKATDVNKEAEGFIYAEPEDLDKIKKKYAKHPYVSLLKSDLEDLTYGKRQVETLHKAKNTTLDLPAERISYGTSPEEDGKDKVLVVTAYLKPSDTEQIEQDDKGGDKLYITRLKYPRGRKVVKINEYIMEDEELPYDDLEFPFERLVNYLLPREYFGMSEIDQTKGPQRVFNKLVNFALDVLVMTGNPIWLSPIEAQVNTRKLTNEPGIVVEYVGSKGVPPPTRQDGASLQPYVFQLIDRMEKWFNGAAGDQEVSRGINPTGVTANAAIENLLEQAQKRIKQKMRNLDSYLMAFGRHWVSRCFQYYTVPEVYRLTNKEGANKYFKFHVEHREVQAEDGSTRTAKFAKIRDFYKNDAGQMAPSEMEKEFEIRGDFDVRVNTISGLPFSKAETEQRVLQLFDRQIIDDEEVLRRLEYPNYEAVLQRVRQKAEAAAMAEQQSKQAQGV